MSTFIPHSVRGYDLLQRIAAGGFGEVYRAFQSSVGREVAIKVILPQHANRPDFIRRFEVEAQLIARMEHPHIVPLYDYWRDPEGAYLVMRWLNSNLRLAIEHNAWSVEAGARLLDQVAAALAVAHREGVVHRDIKPDNILLDEDDNAYLADFGIAKDLNLRDASQEYEFVGSPAYVSPEQIKSDEISQRSDIYCLGLVIYELLTGEKPFPDATTASDLLQKQLNATLPLMNKRHPNIPPALDEILQTATAKDPNHRYPDALRFAAAFRAVIPYYRRMGSQPLAEPLTERELEILQLMVEGLTNQEILDRLVLSESTVRWYLKQIYSKLDVHSRRQAIERAIRLNLLVEPGSVTVRDTPGAEIVSLPALPDTTTQLYAASENPYKGLRAFQEADVQDFFGRATLTEQLLGRMSENGNDTRLLVVVGPSGSGKSSAVRAGLIPALRLGALSDQRHAPFIAEMLPGTHPLEELEAALSRVSINPLPSLIEQLHEDRRGLVRAAKRVLPADQTTELILLVDQFEELFSLVEDESVRLHFIDNLLSAVSDSRSRIRVVLTLRADFYDRPLLYPRLAELVRRNTEVVLPLTARELEQAITAPAERVGMTFEPGLVSTLMRDVGEQPGILPLLQYSLTELFERRQGSIMTNAAYQEMGGVTGALTRRAEEIYDCLDDDQRAAARQLFLRLVTLGEGTEDTRLRTQLAEVASLSGGMEDVLDAFGQYRLLTFDRDPITRLPTVEIAHEALIREWGRLREWLLSSREEVRMQRRLAHATAEWLNARRDPSFLANGARLDQFRIWAEETDLALTGNEQVFLEASIAEQERLEAIEDERKGYEMILAREKAAAQKQAARRLGYLTAALFVGVIAALILLVLVFNQRQTAQQERDKARHAADDSLSLSLASAAREAVLKNDPDLGLSLAVEANNFYQPLPQVGDTLSNIALAPGTRRIFGGHTSPVMAVAVSLDGRYMLTGSGQISLALPLLEDNTMRLWDLQTGAEIRRFEGHTDAIWKVAFSPDGHTAFSGSADRSVIQWDLATGTILQRYEGKEMVPGWNPVVYLAVSPDGKSLLFARYDGEIHLIDINSGKERQVFRLHIPFDFIYCLSFSPNGQTIYSVGMVPGSHLENLVVWDVARGTERHFEISDSDTLNGFRLGPIDIAATVSPDGRLALGVRGTDLVLYDVENAQEIRRFNKIQPLITSIAISRDGRTALTTAVDASLILWNLDQGEPIRVFRGHEGWVTTATFTPDELHGVSGSSDGTARLWDLDSGSETRRLTVTGFDQMWGLALSPDGRTALSGVLESTSQRSVAIQWDMTTGEIIHQFGGHSGAIRDIAYSPDGQTALIISDDDMASLLDIATGAELRRYDYPAPSSVGFALDGRTAVLANGTNGRTLDLESGTLGASYGGGAMLYNILSDERSILLPISSSTLGTFDIETGQQTGVLEGHGSPPRTAAISPDGRYALTGSGEPFLILWNLETHTEIRRLTLPTTVIVNSIAFSYDNRMALAGSNDGLVLLWDISTGQLLARFEGHYAPVWRVRFSPDGQMAFSTGLDGTLRQWSLPPKSAQDWLAWTFANRYVRDLTEAEWKFYNLPADRTIASLRSDYTTPLVASVKSTPLPAASPTPISVSVSIEQRTAVIGDNRGSISPGRAQMWAIEGRKGELLIFNAVADRPTTGVTDLGEQVSSGLLDTWLVVRGPDEIILGENDDFLGALDSNARVDLILPQDGTYKIEVRAAQSMTSGDYTLHVASVLLGIERDHYAPTGGKQDTVSISLDGQRMVAGGAIYQADGSTGTSEFNVWDISTQPMSLVCHHEMAPDEHTNELSIMRFSPDGQTALSANWDTTLMRWDMTQCKKIGSPFVGHKTVIYAIAFTPDGRQVLSGAYDNTARLWDVGTATEIWHLDLGSFVMGAAIEPNGKTALVSSAAGNIVEVDLTTGEVLRTISSPDAPFCIALSPDGKVFATGARSGDIILWDATTGHPIRRLRGHTAPASHVVFSADGRYILSGAGDHTARLWDARDGSELVRFYHENIVSDVALSPDGHTAASSSYDGTVRLWNVPEENK